MTVYNYSPMVSIPVSVQDLKGRRVVLLIAEHSYRAAKFLAAAGRLGVEVTVGSGLPDLMGAKEMGSYIPLDFKDLEGSVEQLVLRAGDLNPEAILACEDDGLEIAALASESLGLPGARILAVRAAQLKSNMRQSLKLAGLPVPEFKVLSLEGGAQQYLPWMKFPVVLKPTFLSGSRGVIRADDPEGFLAAWKGVKQLLGRVKPSPEWSEHAKWILVEEYIDGPEFALEGFVKEGELHPFCIFDKPDPLVGPYFEETIYVTPPQNSDADQKRVIDACALAVRAVEIRNGPVHIEVRLSDRGAFVIDLAPRTIGGYCSRALRFDQGLTLEEVVLAGSLGVDVSAFRREQLASGVMMIPIPSGGVLRGVHGLEDARAVAGIEEVLISIRPGQRVTAPPWGNQYLGFIFSRGPTPSAVVSALRASHLKLSFDIA